MGSAVTVDAAVNIVFPLGTLCSAGPSTSSSVAVISYINGCDDASPEANTGDSKLKTAMQTPNGINIAGVSYCSCYTAAAAATTGSSIFALGFSLLAILASLWK